MQGVRFRALKVVVKAYRPTIVRLAVLAPMLGFPPANALVRQFCVFSSFIGAVRLITFPVVACRLNVAITCRPAVVRLRRMGLVWSRGLRGRLSSQHSRNSLAPYHRASHMQCCDQLMTVTHTLPRVTHTCHAGILAHSATIQACGIAECVSTLQSVCGRFGPKYSWFAVRKPPTCKSYSRKQWHERPTMIT